MALPAGNPTFAGIAAGYSFSLGVTTAGAIFSWGRNQFGQLGNNKNFGSWPLDGEGEGVLQAVHGPLGVGTFSTAVQAAAGVHHSVALDRLAGATRSHDYPLVRPTQTALGGTYDAYVSVLAPDGSALEFSTFLGGSSTEFGYGVAATSEGHAVVTGPTYSADFPLVSPIQWSLNGAFDGFVAEFDPDAATLAFASYLGGSAEDDNENMGAGIASGACGRIYVTGNTNSADFPVTADAFQSKYQDNGVGSPDAFVVRLSRATIDCPASAVLECPAIPDPAVTGRPSTVGLCAAASCEWIDTESSACGGTRVISRAWSCGDGIETLSCNQEIRTVDTTPPIVDMVPLDGACIWPPNHRFWCADDITALVSASDACDAGPLLARVVQCKSSQPEDSIGDGNSGPDCLLLDGGRGICLRAERSGLEPPGRVYTLELEVADGCGNASSAAARVTVPHDQAPTASCLRPTRGEPASRRRR